MNSKIDLTIQSPLSGLNIPLIEIPDPVFSSGMLGKGCAIDPTDSYIVAPFDGLVKQLHRSKHALTIKHRCGLELLIHLGIDTVKCNGEGINNLVKVGDVVKKGQTLTEFDMDHLGLKAKSLITPILITGENHIFNIANISFIKSLDEPLFFVNEFYDLQCSNKAIEPTATSELQILNEHGIHARPAALIVDQAKQYSGQVIIENNLGESASAASITDILSLNIQCGEKIKISACGKNAEEKVNALTKIMSSGLGEKVKAPSKIQPRTQTEKPLLHARVEEEDVIKGICAVHGIGIGVLALFTCQESVVEKKSPLSIDVEIELFQSAIDQANLILKQEISSLEDNQKEIKAILEAHLALLSDSSLIEKTLNFIQSGNSAIWSWQEVTASTEALLVKKGGYLSERAADIKDVSDRVTCCLTGKQTGLYEFTEPTIAIFERITPHDILKIDKTHLQGIVCVNDGVNSHAAIIANNYRLPYLVGVSDVVLKLQSGQKVILNATQGSLATKPTNHQIVYQREKIKNDQLIYDIAWKNAKNKVVTVDGLPIEVAANIASCEDAQDSLNYGADSVGLLRTELLYLEAKEAPNLDQQISLYRKILSVYKKDQVVIIRTLDVGGDKSIPYLQLAKEDNPFLGIRGVRVGINSPNLLRLQFKALIEASKGRKHLHILLPMIASIEEFRVVKALLVELTKNDALSIYLGVMVEVPSVAIMADVLAKEVDFFSIGSNDLTQYTLAMDRVNPQIAHWSDGIHPSVLRLIKQTQRAAQQYGKPNSICGNIATDPIAIPILIGLGVNKLSVSVKQIPLVKYQISNLNFSHCKKLADRALACENASAVRDLVNNFNKVNHESNR